MLESIILGLIQGVAEWLPVSSSGLSTIISINFFGESLYDSVAISLFLHLGTFFSALIYFRKDVIELLKIPFNWKKGSKEYKKIFSFLVVTTILTGVFGGFLLSASFDVESLFNNASKTITIFIGVFLILTGLLQFQRNKGKERGVESIKLADGFYVGAIQSIAVLPGFSRAGLTVAGLLLRKFKSAECLRLSFLMSLPVVLGGNIVLCFFESSTSGFFSLEMIVGAVVAFLAGILSIHLLIRLSKKINFGWFAICFGVLTILAILV